MTLRFGNKIFSRTFDPAEQDLFTVSHSVKRTASVVAAVKNKILGPSLSGRVKASIMQTWNAQWTTLSQ
jgi:hypothetical protein